MSLGMPSALTSLSQASGDTLQQVLQARELQKLEQMAAAEAQQKALMEQARLDLSRRGADRADATLGLSRERFGFDQAQAKTKAEQVAAEQAAKARQATNKAGVLDMVRQGGDQLDPMGRRVMALEAGVPATSFDLPETPEARLQRIEAEADARARATARHRRPAATGTKAPKDNVKAPQRFLDTIQNRLGSTGFENVDNAIKSIQDRWPEWRKTYPGLDLNAVRLALQNLYGKKPTSGAGDALLEKILSSVKGGNFEDDPE